MAQQPRAKTRTRERRGGRETETLKRKILDAALGAFARNGFDGASLIEIATQAETSHPLVLYHFGSKEALWRAVIAYIFDDLKAHYTAVAELSRDLQGADALRMFVRAFVQFSAKNPERISIVLTEFKGNTARTEWLLEEYMRPLYGRLNAIADQIRAEGKIKPIPNYHLAQMIIGAGSTIFMAQPLMKAIYQIDSLDPKIVSAHADWLVEVFLNGLLLDD